MTRRAIQIHIYLLASLSGGIGKRGFVLRLVVNTYAHGTRSQGISQFYLHTPRSSANGMIHTCLCLPRRSWYSFTDRGGMEGWVGLGQVGLRCTGSVSFQ